MENCTHPIPHDDIASLPVKNDQQGQNPAGRRQE